MDASVDLFDKIAKLKREKNAVILAHYYQDPDIQDIADFIGDSLELARAAQSSQAKLILFAGVHFMAEGAKLLNPGSKVILPDLRAGCSLSDSCPPARFREFKKNNPDHFIISYINCSAEIKSLSDVICTSSNAIKIVNRAPKNRPILFAPDRNLGRWVMEQTGREMTLWPGSCMVHETFSERKLIELKMAHPKAKVIAHPECEERVLRHADFIGSTSALLKFVTDAETSKDGSEFIVATEAGILHQMQKRAKGKTFIAAPPNQNCACNECPFMKLNTLEKIALALENETPEIEVSPAIAQKAKNALTLMLEWSN